MKKIINKLLSNINVILPRKLDDKTVYVPMIGGMKVGVSGERWMLELLKRLLPEQIGTFIDVGINLGQTLIKVKAVDPDRAYVGFEPNPVCNNYLDKMITANGYKNCTVIPAGLFPEAQILALNLYQANPDDSSASMIDALRPVDEIKKQIFVPVTPFEPVAAFLKIEKISLIKVDVEGAELEVFEALSAAIVRDRPLILVEILPLADFQDHEQWERQEKIEAYFKQRDYQLYRIQKDASNGFAGLEKIETIGTHAEMHLRDYLVVPLARTKVLEQQVGTG